jgi:hypothetical protein
LHDRLRYTLLGTANGRADGDSWEIQRLAP